MVSKACCTNPVPPTVAAYTPTGTAQKVGSFDVYVTGAGTHYAMCIYDIFGFDIVNTRRFVDTLAQKAGLRVFMPDVFRGKPWPLDNFPPKDWTQLMTWAEEEGGWEKVVRPIVVETIAWAEKQFGKPQTAGNKWVIFGFCFGGYNTVMACKDNKLPFSAGLSYHGGKITVDDVPKLTSPVIFHAASDDDPLPKYEEAAKKRGDALGAACEFFTYDQKHGFCSGRADYSSPENVKAIGQVIERSVAFLKKNYH